MGSTVSSSNISRVDVSKSPRGDEQCVVYSTPDSRTCTLHASVGVDSASVSLRDYTFDREGTTVDIRVHHETNNKNKGGGVGTIDGKHGGNALHVYKDAGQFSIGYGVPHVRCGFLAVTKHRTDTHGDALFVAHVYGIAEQRFSVVVVQVWYDTGKGRFMCTLTGPSRHSSPLEVMLAMRKAYPSKAADHSTGQQTSTTITGLINNTGGPVYGDLNGSIFNFFNVFLKK